MITETKNYIISEELLKETISVLEYYGKSTSSIVEKLKILEREEIEEWGSIVDPDSV
jgi:hypothetical protein